MANLLSQPIALPDELIYNLQHKGVNRTILVNAWRKSFEKGLKRLSLLLRFRGVFSKVKDYSFLISVWLDVGVCQPSNGN